MKVAPTYDRRRVPIAQPGLKYLGCRRLFR